MPHVCTQKAPQATLSRKVKKKKMSKRKKVEKTKDKKDTKCQEEKKKSKTKRQKVEKDKKTKGREDQILIVMSGQFCNVFKKVLFSHPSLSCFSMFGKAKYVSAGNG